MMPPPVYFYSNRMGRIFFKGLGEILGEEEVAAILAFAGLSEYCHQGDAIDPDLKFPFDHISRLQAALEGVYGPRAGSGLALRIGRACLKYVLRDFGPDLGLIDSDFRFLPLPARLKAGTEALAGLFNRLTDQRVCLEVAGKQIFWQIERCPLCWERKSADPCCTLEVGLLQETLYWASGGKYFPVEESKCLACGDDLCTIVIDRIPIG